MYLTSPSPEEAASSLDDLTLLRYIKDITYAVSTAARLKNGYGLTDTKNYPLLMKSRTSERLNQSPLVKWVLDQPAHFMFLFVYGKAMGNEALHRTLIKSDDLSNLEAAYDYYAPHLIQVTLCTDVLRAPKRMFENYISKSFPYRSNNPSISLFEYSKAMLNREWSNYVRRIDPITGRQMSLDWSTYKKEPPFMKLRRDRHKAARFKLVGVTHGDADRILRTVPDTTKVPRVRLHRRCISTASG